MVIRSLLCRSSAALALKRTFAKAASRTTAVEMADQKFQENGVVPDVIKNAPLEVLQVSQMFNFDLMLPEHYSTSVSCCQRVCLVVFCCTGQVSFWGATKFRQ